jgi:pseudouridylate synthase
VEKSIVPSLYGERLMRYTREVTDALDDGRPVVALESTIIAHGLPRPENLEVAVAAEEMVREEGAVPATIAVVEGMVRIGLDREGLEAIAGDGVVKCSARDLAVVMARRATGATTVAATATLAARAGITVFGTGGLGGVHREARESWDESADLTILGQTPITVVCAGVKSVLDVEATLERLETLNVTLLGYRTDRFPGFYLADSGFPVPWRVESPEEVADVHHARAELGLGAIVVANPIEDPLDAELHETVLRSALAAAAAGGIRGKDITPFLLERFHRETGGASLEANVRLLLRNVALAAQIARAVA